MTTRHYDLFGLTFASDFLIPWAPEGTRGGHNVVIRRVTQGEAGTLDEGSNMLRFEVPGIGSYRISGGGEILVEAAPGASEEELRLYLLGSALGVLLHQRGLLVLHANAIVVDGGAMLFMGPSGAGKSTLAAWFASKGFAVLTDDVCALDVSGEGDCVVLPGLARLRITDRAASRFGMDVSGGSLCPSSGKHEIGLPRAGAPKPQKLLACYLLSNETREADASVHKLTDLDAVEMLMANTYRGFALQQLGGSPKHLAACLRVAAEVPCFEARREKNWARFDAIAETLLACARTAASPASSPHGEALGTFA